MWLSFFSRFIEEKVFDLLNIYIADKSFIFSMSYAYILLCMSNIKKIREYKLLRMTKR